MAQIQDIAEKPIIPLDFTVRKDYRLNGDGTKCQIIDQYGRTAWATKEETRSRSIPQYANGPANIDKEYHPCLIGEDELVSLIIAYLGLPRPDVWNDDAKKFEMKTKPEELAESVCLLDHMDDYFKGDISEIREILAYQPDNRVKVILGIRTNNNGNQYQAAYTKQWLKLGTSNYKNVTKEIEEAEQNARDNGREPSTQFVVGPLEEVTIISHRLNSLLMMMTIHSQLLLRMLMVMQTHLHRTVGMTCPLKMKSKY